MTNKKDWDEAFPQDNQIGGSHYKQFSIQPWKFIRTNELNPFQANVIKYVSVSYTLLTLPTTPYL